MQTRIRKTKNEVILKLSDFKKEIDEKNKEMTNDVYKKLNDGLNVAYREQEELRTHFKELKENVNKKSNETNAMFVSMKEQIYQLTSNFKAQSNHLQQDVRTQCDKMRLAMLMPENKTVESGAPRVVSSEKSSNVLRGQENDKQVFALARQQTVIKTINLKDWVFREMTKEAKNRHINFDECFMKVNGLKTEILNEIHKHTDEKLLDTLAQAKKETFKL